MTRITGFATSKARSRQMMVSGIKYTPLYTMEYSRGERNCVVPMVSSSKGVSATHIRPAKMAHTARPSAAMGMEKYSYLLKRSHDNR